MRFDSIRSCFLRVVIGATALVSSGALAQGQLPPGEGHRASVVEATQLPKFCWSQYMDLKGPEYEIHGCGPGMNHYCWGLVELLRANKSLSDRKNRLGYLQRAKGNTVYTMNAMQKYPTCWLRPHVESTYKQVQTSLQVYGIK